MRKGSAFSGAAASAGLFLLLFAACVFAQQGAPGGGPAPPAPDTGREQTRPPGGPVEINDIHDIKPPIDPGFDPAVLYYALLAVVILALVGAGLWYWQKRRIKEWEAFIEPLSPDEAAHRLLDELRGARDITGKEFYFRLSAILRGYIRGRFSIDAPEMTTEEFVPRIEGLAMGRDLRHQLKTLVLFSDPIKFAAQPAAKDKMMSDLVFVRDLVKQTTTVEAGEENESKDSGRD